MINRVPKAFWLFVALLAGVAIATAIVNGQEACLYTIEYKPVPTVYTMEYKQADDLGTIVPMPQDDCDTCGCGGLVDEGVLEMSSGRLIRVWIDPDGSMAQLSKADARRLLLLGVQEIDQVCGLDFEIVDKRNQARAKVEFVPNMDALGRAYTSGRIILNSTRTLNNAESRRILQALMSHELGHLFGLNHVSGRSCTMHAHLGTHWCPATVKRLQDKWGLPESNDKPWHPTDRVAAGRAMTKAVDDFKRADQAFRTVRNRRNALVGTGDVDGLQSANDIVRDRLAKRTAAGELVAKRHREWWAINKAWNTSGVKGFVRLGQ